MNSGGQLRSIHESKFKQNIFVIVAFLDKKFYANKISKKLAAIYFRIIL
jgi:hypothetical protein